jgi:uncharacterized metal-binding protein YceD (DUF177 family)
MSKFSQYNIDLKEIADSQQTFNFLLDDDYFKKIDSPEVQRGNIEAVVTVKKPVEGMFELHFSLDGYATLACNRCLDDMRQPVTYKEILKVKFGTTLSEEGDTVIVPEAEGQINIAWFLYEFVALNIPIKHVHLPGECNKQMMTKLKRHLTHSTDDDSPDMGDIMDDDDDVLPTENEPDPRWDDLKNIFDN